ncbi:alpha-N-acetylglucosaminidase [Luteolibacter sp. LG18]|uniref:alpha-N-acetylglucosaminidase n=1 Tax=Luteolibacter sp. LG18 TaxID=2819286 RepID=UPI002B2A5ED2|nr:alpha-N-acetylglucosaminidase [Luteolibacter sp. LG18]
MPLRSFLCLLALSLSSFAEPDSAVRGLITRYAPAQAGKITVETIPAADGRDAYEIEAKDGRIVLRGNTGVAQASAFYHYLKDYCHAHVSWNGDNLAVPAGLPAVPEKVRVVSPVVHRMAYNYCTHGYTMPFWDEAQWDRELDWLALHGLNLILVTEGQEAVWQNTFEKFGYSREEVRQWLCSPVHQPWQFMQNMEGVLSPPQAVIDARTRTGQHIVARCRELGIQPILQGYYGMLPSGFTKKHPEAKIFPQGTWAGGNRRPDMLDPSDPLYAKIARTFMEEQRKIYGDASFLAADPFHEGGSSKGMDRGTVYKQIQDAMLAFDPKITLVKQCWQTSNKEMFDAGKKDQSLALDLNCDYRPFWRKANGYDGTPWTWCFLFNFGGNLALEGNPAKLATDFGGTLADPARKNLSGTALVPEGSHTNPLMYELMTEMAWRGAPADTTAWVNLYLHARYGVRSSSAEEAWKGILATAYATKPAESPINSILTARPRWDANLRGRTWSPGSKVAYDNRELAKAWNTLLKAAPELGGKDTYRYDLADVSRQTLTNYSRSIYDRLLAAVEANDLPAFKRNKEILLGLIADLDELTGTRADWLMGAWVADARKWGKTPADAAYMDRIARMIVTTWVENPQTDLADYANREWNGLLGEYYLPRWKMFLDATEMALAAGKRPDMATYNRERGKFETEWVNSGKTTLAARPKGDTVEVSRRLLQKYGAAILAIDPLPRVELDGPAWKPADFRGGNHARLSLAVPALAVKGGELAVTFSYKSGQNALRIEEVALEADGKVIGQDTHEGWTGLENRANRFTLAVPASARTARKLVVIARVETMAGTDSAGEITWGE